METYVEYVWYMDPTTGEIMNEVPVEWEVAVFPLSRIDLDPPMFVQATKTRGECRKGSKYYLTAIYKDGRVSVMAGRDLHPMENFVQLLNRRVLDAAPPTLSIEQSASQDPAKPAGTTSNSGSTIATSSTSRPGAKSKA